jgi:hypothetical protein
MGEVSDIAECPLNPNVHIPLKHVRWIDNPNSNFFSILTFVLDSSLSFFMQGVFIKKNYL